MPKLRKIQPTRPEHKFISVKQFQDEGLTVSWDYYDSRWYLWANSRIQYAVDGGMTPDGKLISVAQIDQIIPEGEIFSLSTKPPLKASRLVCL